MPKDVLAREPIWDNDGRRRGHVERTRCGYVYEACTLVKLTNEDSALAALLEQWIRTTLGNVPSSGLTTDLEWSDGIDSASRSPLIHLSMSLAQVPIYTFWQLHTDYPTATASSTLFLNTWTLTTGLHYTDTSHHAHSLLAEVGPSIFSTMYSIHTMSDPPKRGHGRPKGHLARRMAAGRAK